MHIKPDFRVLLLAAVMVLAGRATLSAQFSNTYYHMFGVPQANQLNPAFQSNCNTYVGFPVLSTLKFDLELPVAYNEIFSYNSSLDRIITFMHPQGDKQSFLDALDQTNTLRFELGTSLLSTGWRKENFYFTIDFTERMDAGFTFPKDLAEFLINGTKNQDRFSFGGFGPDLNYFHEFAIGASFNSDDEFQVGFRGKLLLGMVNLRNTESDINLKTAMDEWSISSRIDYNLTVPYLDFLPVDDNGTLLVDSLSNMDIEDLFGFPASPEELLTLSELSNFMGLKNPGFALDFGFNYHPVEKISVSASLVDIGFIRWRNQAYRFSQTMDYSFGGLELSLDDDADPGQELLDSLENSYRIGTTKGSYTALLSGKVYYGIAYEPTEKVRLGFVGRTRIYKYNFYNQFTFSANVMPISMFSTSLSYSIYNGHYHNLGLGLSLRLGPLNLYVITDQGPSAYLIPQSFSAMNFRLGLNIATGCRKKSKKMQDLPMIE